MPGQHSHWKWHPGAGAASFSPADEEPPGARPAVAWAPCSMDLWVYAPGPNRASGDSMVGGLPRKWHHMRPVSCFCVSSLSGWLGCDWLGCVVGWVVPQGQERSFLVEIPLRLRTNLEASGGSLRDLCQNSSRFVALGVCVCVCAPPTSPPEA